MEGSRKGLVIAIVALAIVLAVVGTSWVWLQIDARLAVAEGNAPEPETEPKQPAPDPRYVTIGPMTVNLQSEEFNQRLLYVGLSLRVGDERTQEVIEKHMPEAKSRILMLLSSYSAEELTSANGKQQLTRRVLELFEQPFADPQPPLTIQSVLYTDFIIQ